MVLGDPKVGLVPHRLRTTTNPEPQTLSWLGRKCDDEFGGGCINTTTLRILQYKKAQFLGLPWSQSVLWDHSTASGTVFLVRSEVGSRRLSFWVKDYCSLLHPPCGEPLSSISCCPFPVEHSGDWVKPPLIILEREKLSVQGWWRRLLGRLYLEADSYIQTNRRLFRWLEQSLGWVSFLLDIRKSCFWTPF